MSVPDGVKTGRSGRWWIGVVIGVVVVAIVAGIGTWFWMQRPANLILSDLAVQRDGTRTTMSFTIGKAFGVRLADCRTMSGANRNDRNPPVIFGVSHQSESYVFDRFATAMARSDTVEFDSILAGVEAELLVRCGDVKSNTVKFRL